MDIAFVPVFTVLFLDGINGWAKAKTSAAMASMREIRIRICLSFDFDSLSCLSS